MSSRLVFLFHYVLSAASVKTFTGKSARLSFHDLFFLVFYIRDIKDRATQIATAAEEQAAVSNEITKSVSSIGDSAQQSAEGSHEMAKAGEHQAKLARDLSDIARSFRT